MPALVNDLNLDNKVLGPVFRRGFEEGIRQRNRRSFQQGFKLGIGIGELNVIRCLIRVRFGAVPAWAEERLSSFSAAELEAVSARLLKADDLEELLPYGALRRPASPGLCKNGGMPPQSNGILESSLYVRDVAASARFYATVFGFRVIRELGERGCALGAGERQVLLLFKRGGSLGVPAPHDGDGELHLAFAATASELERWEGWLEENGIPIEERRSWELGGRSLYFRDPDRHLLEIASPGVWSIY